MHEASVVDTASATRQWDDIVDDSDEDGPGRLPASDAESVAGDNDSDNEEYTEGSASESD